MAKRARYDGPFDEQPVYVRPGDTTETKPAYVVKRGGLLPADAPAKLRDELLGRDDWSEVDQATAGKKDGDN